MSSVYTSRDNPADLTLRLPNELLCLVIEDVAFHEPPSHKIDWLKKSSSRIKKLGFLRLSEVSRRFRALMISMPSLWARIPWSIPEASSDLALARACSEPLKVLVSPSSLWVTRRESGDKDEAYARLLRSFVQNAGRIRSLEAKDLKLLKSGEDSCASITLPLLEEIDMQFKFLKLSTHSKYIRINAPALQHATFYFSSQNGPSPLHSSMPSFHRLGQLISLDFPALQSLYINLDGTFLKPGHAFRPGWILDVLATSPNLNNLELHFELPGHWLPPIDWKVDACTICLPHLEYMSFSGSRTSNMPGLIAQVAPSLPSRCFLQWRWEDDLTDEDVLAFATCSAHLLRRPLCDGLHVQFRLREEGLGWASAGVFTSHGDLGKSSASYTADATEVVEFELLFDCDEDGSFENEVMSVFLPSLEQNTIKRLVIEDAVPQVWSFIRDLVTHTCPDVCELVIIRPWSKGDEGRFEQTMGFPLFDLPDVLPSLKTVYITFNDDMDSDTLYRCWDEFLTWLKRRTAANNRVESVHILGFWHVASESEDDYWERNRRFCADAASFVRELVDERIKKIRKQTNILQLTEPGPREFTSFATSPNPSNVELTSDESGSSTGDSHSSAGDWESDAGDLETGADDDLLHGDT